MENNPFDQVIMTHVMTLREYLEEDARSRKLLLGPNSDPHFGNGDKTTCRHMVGGGKRRTGGFHRHLKLGSLTSTNDNASSVSSARGSTISNPQPRERSITPRAVIVRISRGCNLFRQPTRITMLEKGPAVPSFRDLFMLERRYIWKTPALFLLLACFILLL